MRVRKLMAVLALAAGLVLFGAASPAWGYGDYDGDGDVDLDDFAEFPGCMAGPGGGLGSECGCLDLDGSGEIDLADFAAFQEAFTN